MDLVELEYSDSRIIHDYYVRNWKDEQGSSKLTIARRAVLAYHGDTEMPKNVDPASVQSTIKETSEAINHLVALAPGGLGDDSDQALLRARQELLEAIDAMQNGLAQLDNELTLRKIEIIR